MTRIRTLVNGENTETISVFDRGLHYGDGVFETMAVFNGKIRLWDEHWLRLLEGCERLQIDAPDRSTIEQEIVSLSDSEQPLVIKLIVTRGTGARGYRKPQPQNVNHVIFQYPWTRYPDEYTQVGVNVRYCATPLSENKMLAGMKHLNRLEQVLARNEWTSEEWQEGLMLSNQGYVVDGTMSNLFALKSNILITPDLNLCGVRGVMRQTVIKIAKSLGIDVQVKNILPVEIESMDEVFLSNSLFGIWPVKRVEETRFSTGKITRQLREELDKCLGMA